MMLKRGVEEEFEWRSGRGSGDLSNAVNAIVLDNSSCVRRLHTSLISGNKVSSPCVTCDKSVAFFCESMFFFFKSSQMRMCSFPLPFLSYKGG